VCEVPAASGRAAARAAGWQPRFMGVRAPGCHVRRMMPPFRPSVAVFPSMSMQLWFACTRVHAHVSACARSRCARARAHALSTQAQRTHVSVQKKRLAALRVSSRLGGAVKTDW
jgi:hypothetical protein